MPMTTVRGRRLYITIFPFTVQLLSKMSNSLKVAQPVMFQLRSQALNQTTKT